MGELYDKLKAAPAEEMRLTVSRSRIKIEEKLIINAKGGFEFCDLEYTIREYLRNGTDGEIVKKRKAFIIALDEIVKDNPEMSYEGSLDTNIRVKW